MFKINEDPESTIIIDDAVEDNPLTLPSTSKHNPDVFARINANTAHLFETCNPELDTILKKYTNPQLNVHTNTQASTSTVTLVELSSDDENPSNSQILPDKNNITNKFSVNSSSSHNELDFYYDSKKATEKSKFGLSPSSSEDDLQNILSEDKKEMKQKFGLSPSSSENDLQEIFHMKKSSILKRDNFGPSSSDDYLQRIFNEPEKNNKRDEFNVNYNSSEEDTTSLRNFYQQLKKVKTNDTNQKPQDKLHRCNSDVLSNNDLLGSVDDTEKLSSEEDLSDEKSSSSPKVKKKRQSKEDKEKRRAERELQKAKKREDNERAKKFKQMLSKANKNIKPEECIKFITIHVDSQIESQKYGREMLTALQESESSFDIQSQIIPYTITWTRKVQTHFINDKENLVSAENITETDEVLLIMDWNLIIDLIHSHMLITHIKSIQSMLVNKKLSLAIFGLENYFKYLKSKKRTEWQEIPTQRPNKYDKIYKDVPKVSKKTLQFALTELQLLCSCSHRMVETPQDLSAMVLQYTKSIAQIPYKQEKYEKGLQASWYKDTVRVDKNGIGLQRLWKQQLTTFPLTRLESAEAIMAQYPTPTALMNAYSQHDQAEGEKLIQDIQIRRMAGSLTSVRRIGPELSKKVFKFFTSDNGNLVL